MDGVVRAGRSAVGLRTRFRMTTTAEMSNPSVTNRAGEYMIWFWLMPTTASRKAARSSTSGNRPGLQSGRAGSRWESRRGDGSGVARGRGLFSVDGISAGIGP
jgi:hypothetical protein